jgi:DNA-binding transcriptional regulator LsrR (DeoR family)
MTSLDCPLEFDADLHGQRNEPVPRKSGIQVVQILGGLGNASSQNQSAYLASHLASLVNGTAYFYRCGGH